MFPVLPLVLHSCSIVVLTSSMQSAANGNPDVKKAARRGWAALILYMEHHEEDVITLCHCCKSRMRESPPIFE